MLGSRQKCLQAARRQFLKRFHPPLVFYQVNRRARRHTISKTVLVVIALSPKNLTKIMVSNNVVEASHKKARIDQGKMVSGTTMTAKTTKTEKQITRLNLSGIIATIKVLNKIKNNRRLKLQSLRRKNPQWKNQRSPERRRLTKLNTIEQIIEVARKVVVSAIMRRLPKIPTNPKKMAEKATTTRRTTTKVKILPKTGTV